MFIQYKLTLKYLLIFIFLNICSSQISVFTYIDIIMLVLIIKITINFYF